MVRRILIALAALTMSIVSMPAVYAQGPRTEFPLRFEDHGPLIEVVHKRLSWLGYPIDETELAEQRFGQTSLAGLRAFERKFGLRETTAVTQRAWDDLKRIAGPVGSLPPSCRAGTVICVSKSQLLLRYVRDGKVLLTADARFGVPGEETANGVFRVVSRSRDHVSSAYRTAMPYSLFFNGNQAIHYSPWFRRDGYAGGSHGCINLRDRAKAEWVFERSPVGTTVSVNG